MNKCCGNCKHHIPGEMTGEGDFACNNGESEAYGLETNYDDYCEEFEERSKMILIYEKTEEA